MGNGTGRHRKLAGGRRVKIRMAAVTVAATTVVGLVATDVRGTIDMHLDFAGQPLQHVQQLRR